MTGPFKEHGAALIANGYQIVPIPLGDKRPALKDWPNLLLSQESFLKLAKKTGTDGVGILTKYTPAIDVDILDESIVRSIASFIRRNITKDAPLRVGRWPKQLYLFKTSEPFEKITSAWFIDPKNPKKADGKDLKQRIEILGNGQQFVAYHTHPDTGKPYEWPEFGENPLDIRRDDLVELDVDAAQSVCDEFERIAERMGWRKAGEGTSGGPTGDVEILLDDLPPAEEEDEIDRVKSALATISADCDRDTYLRVLAAMKWTQWSIAEELARDWAESAPDAYNEKDFNSDWRSLKAERNGRKTATIASVYKMAKDNGWDASRPAAEVSVEQMREHTATFTEKAKALSEGDSAAVAELLAEIRAADVDDLTIAFIFKEIVKAAKISLAEVRKAYRATREASGLSTHATYANKLAEEIEESSGVAGIAVEGKIFTFSPTEMVWKGKTPEMMSTTVIKHFDGKENCERLGDYIAIAKVLHNKLAKGNEDFFNNAPVGMAAGTTFYSVGDVITKQSIKAEHRQRVLFPVKPVKGEMPLFERFLDQTFAGDTDDKQRNLLQEIIGSTLLGFFYKMEKVVLLKGPGRAGKGTIMKIIEALFPRNSRTAVVPTKWTQEYYLAQMAGARINLVGEIDEEGAIDGALLKTVTGRDPLTGRMPAQMPFEFTNTATHIFNGNYFPPTRDQSDAFFSRWVLLEFRNSLLTHEQDIDHDLAAKIIAEELPAVAAWAMAGAKRLKERGKLDLPPEHFKLMDQWRKRSNSVIEFVQDTDVCRLGSTHNHRVRRSEFYPAYAQWCRESGRKALGKQKVHELIESPPIQSLGISFTSSKGNWYIRGIMLSQSAFFDADDGPGYTGDDDF